jgi:hypothetical protein
MIPYLRPAGPLRVVRPGIESGDVDITEPSPPPVVEEPNPLLGILLLVGAGVGGYYAGDYLGKGNSDADMYKYGGAAVGVIGLYLFSRMQNGGA